jgi:hypothetical protein
MCVDSIFVRGVCRLRLVRQPCIQSGRIRWTGHLMEMIVSGSDKHHLDSCPVPHSSRIRPLRPRTVGPQRRPDGRVRARPDRWSRPLPARETGFGQNSSQYSQKSSPAGATVIFANIANRIRGSKIGLERSSEPGTCRPATYRTYRTLPVSHDRGFCRFPGPWTGRIGGNSSRSQRLRMVAKDRTSREVGPSLQPVASSRSQAEPDRGACSHRIAVIGVGPRDLRGRRRPGTVDDVGRFAGGRAGIRPR